MTNEEKAREIAIKNRSSIHRLVCMRVDYNYEDCEKSAMEMAKWKDEQCNSITKCNLDTLNKILKIIDRKENNETKVEEIEVVANAGYALLKQLADKFNI